jgi:hypothetical protein
MHGIHGIKTHKAHFNIIHSKVCGDRKEKPEE